MRTAQLFLIASSLAYTTILSLVPLLAVSFAIFQAFGGLDKLYQTLEPWIVSKLAAQAGEQAMQSLRASISNANAKALGLGGLLGLLFTSFSMLSNVEKAIHQVWRSRIERNWFHRIAAYWLFITLGPLGLALAIGFASSAATNSDLPLVRLLPSQWSVALLGVALLFALYKGVPTRPVHWLAALGAAVWGAFGLAAARSGYSFYVRHAMTYDRVYGSLGAVPILLVWIYLVWLIVLTGVALSAVLQARLHLIDSSASSTVTPTGTKP